MPVPYTFAGQSGSIPLQEIDDNFSNVSNYVETAGTVTASAQPNIQSVGTLTGLTVVGTVTATGFSGTSLGVIGNITGGNLQSNGIIKSNGVIVNGNLTVSTTVTAQGNVTGQYILGNGYYLTGISSGSSNYSNANVAAYLPTYTGNITAGNITITGTYRGNGAGITNVPGSSITGTVTNAFYASTALTVTATSLPNLSTVGTLGALSVNGGISAGSVTSAGNISGAYILGDGSKLTNLPSSGNSNYGNSNVAAYLPTYTGQLNGVTINSGKYYGNGAGLTNLTGSAVTGPVPNANYAAQASTVTASSQPSIRSVGTLSSLAVSGTISTGSLSATGNVSAAYFIGDGSKLTNLPSGGNSNYGNSNVAAYLPTYTGQLTGVTINNGTYYGTYYGSGAGLTNIQGSVVTGTVANANNATQAATVTTAAQPNITSVGTLSSLNVNGNIAITGSGKYLGNGATLTGVVRAQTYNGITPGNVYIANAPPTSEQGSIGDIWYQTFQS